MPQVATRTSFTAELQPIKNGRPRIQDIRRKLQLEIAELAPQAIAVLRKSLNSSNADTQRWASVEILSRSIPHIREDHIIDDTDANPAPQLTAREAETLLQLVSAGTDGSASAQVRV